MRSSGPARPLSASAQSLFRAWALQAVLAVFLAWWLLRRGTWAALVEGEPGGISVAITALALVLALWCGRRAWVLQAQAAAGGQGAWARAYAAPRGRAGRRAGRTSRARSATPSPRWS